MALLLITLMTWQSYKKSWWASRFVTWIYMLLLVIFRELSTSSGNRQNDHFELDILNTILYSPVHHPYLKQSDKQKILSSLRVILLYLSIQSFSLEFLRCTVDYVWMDETLIWKVKKWSKNTLSQAKLGLSQPALKTPWHFFFINSDWNEKHSQCLIWETLICKISLCL